MTPGPGIDPGTHWCALATAPFLLPSLMSLNTKNIFMHVTFFFSPNPVLVLSKGNFLMHQTPSTENVFIFRLFIIDLSFFLTMGCLQNSILTILHLFI